MTLRGDKNKRMWNSLFFEPGMQQGDHWVPIDHRTDLMQIADGVIGVNLPDTCNCVLAQAIDEDVNYTLSGTNPSVASGFVLIAGNDPLAIPVGKNTILKFHASADDARLELQFGTI